MYFIQADLKSQNIRGVDYNWYDLSDKKIQQKLNGQPFDVLIVDAPIANVSNMARYPALPNLLQYLADDFVVFLDDIERKDETEIAAFWCSEFDLVYQKSAINGGVGIMRPKNTPHKYNIS